MLCDGHQFCIEGVNLSSYRYALDYELAYRVLHLENRIRGTGSSEVSSKVDVRLRALGDWRAAYEAMKLMMHIQSSKVATIWKFDRVS